MILRVREVHRTYRLGGAGVAALRGVSLEAAAGSFTSIVGRSGSGKSTLLNLIGGLDRPSEGSIEVDGRELERLSSDELARYRRETVGMIFQSFNLVGSMSALENVALPQAFGGVRRGAREERARELLASVGLADRGHHRPVELSGGEQQRVAIARALANRPRLLLADEPTGNLDSRTAGEVLELVGRLRQGGLTVVMVTHDAEAAGRVSDRVVRLADGRVA